MNDIVKENYAIRKDTEPDIPNAFGFVEDAGARELVKALLVFDAGIFISINNALAKKDSFDSEDLLSLKNIIEKKVENIDSKNQKEQKEKFEKILQALETLLRLQKISQNNGLFKAVLQKLTKK